MLGGWGVALSCSCLGPTPLATCNNMAQCVGDRAKIKRQPFIRDVRGTSKIVLMNRNII